MDLNLFSAIPKAALFFLLLVGLAILAEIIYLIKKKLDSHEVTLPKSLQTPSQLPQPAVVSVTTEVISETPKKSRFTKKTTMILLSTLLIALTIPVGLALVRQRQVVQKMAALCDTVGQSCSEDYPEACDNGTGTRICHKSGTCTCAGGGPCCSWGAGSTCDACIPNATTPPPSTPTPPPGGCVSSGNCDNKECCGANVCHNSNCVACGTIPDEPTCWTHVKCHWESGSCQNGPGPTPGSGSCTISCSAGHNSVSVSQTGGDCSGAVVTAVWFASTCTGDSGFCGGQSRTETGSLPFNRGGANGGCGSYQSDISASTNKGGSCSNSAHGTDICGGGATPTPTPPGATPTPTPTPGPQCLYVRAYNSNWQQITNLAAIQTGQNVYFAAKIQGNIGNINTGILFTINNTQLISSTKNNNDEFYIQYTIPGPGAYTVSAEINFDSPN